MDEGDVIAIACETVEWKFKCSKRWADLMPTNEERVKHCMSCHQDVYLCATVEEVNHRARLGQCIGWKEPSVSEQDEPIHHLLGEPTVRYDAY